MNIRKIIREAILDTQKMWGWYPRFEGRYYKDIDSAKGDVEHVVDHNNKQFGSIFGNDNSEEIIDLFNFVETKKGVKIEPKIKQPKEKKPKLEYNTNDELVKKQKYLWSDIRGIELGRYLSGLKYINTNDSEIYGTEKIDEQKVLNIIEKIKNDEELPPILLDYDYGILDGHHRWEAAKRLKIDKIPIVIYEYPDEAITENISESSSNPFDLSEEELKEIANWGLTGNYSSSGCWDDNEDNIEAAIDCAVGDFTLFLSKPYPIELGDVPSNPIIYRLMRLKTKDDLKKDNLGTSWFSNPKQYENHEFFQMLDYLKPWRIEEGEVYLIKGQTSVNNIDVANTLWQRSTQWWENEIVIKDDSSIKFISIQKMSEIT